MTRSTEDVIVEFKELIEAGYMEQAAFEMLKLSKLNQIVQGLSDIRSEISALDCGMLPF